MAGTAYRDAQLSLLRAAAGRVDSRAACGCA